MGTKDDGTDLGHFATEVIEILDDLRDVAGRKCSFCSKKASFKKNQGVITFDELFVSSNSIPGSAMSLATGEFTAGAAGSYLLTVSLQMQGQPGKYQKVWYQVKTG